MQIAVAGSPHAFEQAPDDPSILSAALRAGVPLAYECNSGGCGTCRIKIVAGDSRALRDDAPGLSERDRRRGVMLACQTLALTDLLIEARLSGGTTGARAPLPRRTLAQPLDARDLTRDLRVFRFQSPEPATFLPGQYALLEQDGIRRCYSMSNLPNSEGVWEFVIKRVPGGAFSQRLFGRAPQPLVIDGPYGFAYVRPESTRDVVCIAGGSGLSPILSIARSIVARGDRPHALDVFYGGRTAADLCLHEALPGVAGEPGVELHSVVSEPAHELSRGWTGATGFVHEAVAGRLGSALREREIYFAGPPPMASATQRMLVLEQSVPVEQIHFDRFY